MVGSPHVIVRSACLFVSVRFPPIHDVCGLVKRTRLVIKI